VAAQPGNARAELQVHAKGVDGEGRHGHSPRNPNKTEANDMPMSSHPMASEADGAGS
jgi:hypothetical protein